MLPPGQAYDPTGSAPTERSGVTSVQRLSVRGDDDGGATRAKDSSVAACPDDCNATEGQASRRAAQRRSNVDVQPREGRLSRTKEETRAVVRLARRGAGCLAGAAALLSRG